MDVNRLLNVGDEITHINDVNVTSMALEDVVLIMQYVQKMVLTLKVLRGVADTLHNLKARKRRALPRTPSHLEREKAARAKSNSGIRNSDTLPQNYSGFDPKSSREGSNVTYHEASLTNRFHGSAAEPVKVQVDVHSYDDVDFSAMESKGPLTSKQLSLGNSSLPTAKNAIADDIDPYSEVQIPRLVDKADTHGHRLRPSGGTRKEDNDDINPYAQVTSELRATLSMKKGSELQVASSSSPVTIVDLISPYSEIKRCPHKAGPLSTAAAPDTTAHSTPGKDGEDKINPYAEVSKELKIKLRKKKEKQLEVDDRKTEAVGREIVDPRASTKIPTVEHNGAERLSVMLKDYTPGDDQMDLGGLLDIIKTAQFGPRSPVVRKSFIFDEPETEDPIDPSHIYAQINRNRKHSSSENISDEETSDHRNSNVQPPSPPKSPVPLDPDDFYTLPSILPAEDQSSVHSNTVEEERTFFSSRISESPKEDAHFSGELESPMLLKRQREDMNLALTEALAELDDKDAEPPPLPPPYVPDEGPPEFSDSEDDREEWKSETHKDEENGLALNDQERRQHNEEHHKNETVPELSAYPGNISEEQQSLRTVPDLISSDSVAGESHKESDKASSASIPHIFVSPPPESPAGTSDQERHGKVAELDKGGNDVSDNKVAFEEEAMEGVDDEWSSSSADGGHLKRLKSGHTGDSDDIEEQSHAVDTSLDSDFEQPTSLPPAPPELPPPEPPLSELPPPKLFSPELPPPELPPSELPSHELSSPEHPPPEIPPPEISPPALPPSPSPPRGSEHPPPPSSSSLPPELPPPPPPPMAPPEEDGDGEDTDEDKKSDNSGISSSNSYIRLPTLKIQDIGTSSPSDKRFSGMLVVKISGLNTSSKKSSNFWATNAMQKMIFILSVDNCIKINTTLPLRLHQKQADSEDPEEYHVILLQNFHVKFSLHSICLPNISKCTKLVDIFPSQQESSRNILVSFEHYGDLQLSLLYHPMASTVSRLNPQGASPQAQFSDYVLLNSASGYPLILEHSIKVVEKFGLKTAHLYDRCVPKLNKKRALASCMENLDNQSIKQAVIKCSVHAFTGIIVDFFCELPEPFFTNRLSSDLTQAASLSRDPKVLDQFLEKLPKDETKTLTLLISHFKTLCQHGNKNGVSVKLLSRLFGPLLLIPSLSPDTVSTQPLLDFAEDHFSQSRVIELLLSRESLV